MCRSVFENLKKKITIKFTKRRVCSVQNNTRYTHTSPVLRRIVLFSALFPVVPTILFRDAFGPVLFYVLPIFLCSNSYFTCLCYRVRRKIYLLVSVKFRSSNGIKFVDKNTVLENY